MRTSEPESSWRLNAICPYFTMFPLTFPLRVLRSVDKGWVLDPFCGRGTTNFAARLLGLPSVGLDSSRVAHAVTQAKLAYATDGRVTRRCLEILSGADPVDVPSGAFWDRAFHRETLVMICKLREALRNARSDTDIVLRAVVLGILHGPRNKRLATYLSNQMPRTYATKPDAALRYWRRHRQYPRFIDVGDAVARRAYRMLNSLPERSAGRAYLRDSRRLDELDLGRMFTSVVTSPPYLGLRTYRPDQWLREWFMGSSSTVKYDVRGQIATGDADAFATQLSTVWASVARVCKPKARLVIRFGALASVDRSPNALLRQSLDRSSAAWRVVTIRDVPQTPRGRRQSDQFGGGKPTMHEIDMYAVLDPSC